MSTVPPAPVHASSTPAQDKLARYVVGELRGLLEPRHLRALGVPSTVMSDAEFGAALRRDRDPRTHPTDDSGAYDRRGLLNIIAFLEASLRG